MVTVILFGLATMTALVWTVTSTMALEIAAEKRRVATPFQHSLPSSTAGTGKAPVAA
ncbi:MAG: hypothetical protein ICV75_00995 [Nitrospiraceae bacterium]|nr:hypothetical protein [Nitrospiraceae bacterium]